MLKFAKEVCHVVLGCHVLIGGFCFSVGAEEAQSGKIGNQQLVIEPSSTKVPLATADLTVSPLVCRDGVYSGEYKIKVSPFTFKNDFGSLKLNVSKRTAENMAKGESTKFTGVATSAKDGKTKAIKGDTTPKTGENGTVSFVVTTEDGDLLFNSTYRLVGK